MEERNTFRTIAVNTRSRLDPIPTNCLILAFGLEWIWADLRIDGYTSGICFYSPAQIHSIEKSKILFDGNLFNNPDYVYDILSLFLIITLRNINFIVLSFQSSNNCFPFDSQQRNVYLFFLYTDRRFSKICVGVASVITGIKLPDDKSLVEIILL